MKEGAQLRHLWVTSFVAAVGVGLASGQEPPATLEEVGVPADAQWDTRFRDPHLYVPAHAMTTTTDGHLFLGGRNFSQHENAGPGRFKHVARWDGTVWLKVGRGTTNGVEGTVRVMASTGNRVYVGGDFATVNGGAWFENDFVANHVAVWTGEHWQRLGGIGVEPGVDRPVRAMAAHDENLYVGGDISRAGDLEVNHVARWDGTSWERMGSGIPLVDGAHVTAMAVDSQGRAYAAGRMEFGFLPVRHRIARFEDGHWVLVGGGFDGPVNAIEIDDGRVGSGSRTRKETLLPVLDDRN